MGQRHLETWPEVRQVKKHTNTAQIHTSAPQGARQTQTQTQMRAGAHKQVTPLCTQRVCAHARSAAQRAPRALTHKQRVFVDAVFLGEQELEDTSLGRAVLGDVDAFFGQDVELQLQGCDARARVRCDVRSSTPPTLTLCGNDAARRKTLDLVRDSRLVVAVLFGPLRSATSQRHSRKTRPSPQITS